MKKIVPVALAVALTGAVGWTAYTWMDEKEVAQEAAEIVTAASPVEDDTTKLTEGLNMEETPDFLVHTGTVKAVEQWEKGEVYVTIGEGDDTFNLLLHPQYSLIVDDAGNEATIEEGMTFTSYTAFNKPTVMIYPPRYAPDVFIVHTQEGGQFEQTILDDAFLNKERMLRYHLSDETLIVNLQGASVAKETVPGQPVLTFYGPTTRSIPAQTTPNKIIVLTLPQ